MAKLKSTRALIVLPAFFALNASLSMLNRWALGIQGFRFPLILTSSHAFFGFLFMLPALLLVPGMWSKYRIVLLRDWRGMAVVGCWLSANIALNNLSLVYITLSLNQVIRASIPLVTAVVSALFERKAPRSDESIGLVILCVGVATAISEASASGDSFGVGLCMLSVFAGAAMLTTTARVLAGRVNSVQLAFFTSPVTCACLLPPFFVLELDGFTEYVGTRPAVSAGILIIGSLLAGAYNIVHNDLVSITDPVTTCVLGQVKIVALMVLSAMYLDEGKDFTRRMSFGCACAILGFSIYSWAKIKQTKQRPSGPLTRSQSRSNARTPTHKMLRILISSDTTTPPRTLPGLQTPTANGSKTPGSRMRLRTPSTVRKTPGGLV